MSILPLIPLWFALALLIPTVWAVRGAYRRAKGWQAVTCPESGQPALIALDPRNAALMHVIGNPPGKIQSCSHWPEREQCAQGCLVNAAR